MLTEVKGHHPEVEAVVLVQWRGGSSYNCQWIITNDEKKEETQTKICCGTNSVVEFLKNAVTEKAAALKVVGMEMETWPLSLATFMTLCDFLQTKGVKVVDISKEAATVRHNLQCSVANHKELGSRMTTALFTAASHIESGISKREILSLVWSNLYSSGTAKDHVKVQVHLEGPFEENEILNHGILQCHCRCRSQGETLSASVLVVVGDQAPEGISCIDSLSNNIENALNGDCEVGSTTSEGGPERCFVRHVVEVEDGSANKMLKTFSVTMGVPNLDMINLSCSFIYIDKSWRSVTPLRWLQIPYARASFCSDNSASIHPKVRRALESLGTRTERIGYGDDAITSLAKKNMRGFFECDDAQVEFLYGGTGGNMTILSACLRRGCAIVAADCSHMNEDESGGPEFHGTKILPVKSVKAKICVEKLEETIGLSICHGFHRAPAKMVSITQPTELGTVYTIEEIKEVAAICRKYKLLLHMDGARLGNALHMMQATPAEMTWKCGVDLLTFGGTKHGLTCGEAFVGFPSERWEADPDFPRIQKMMGQKSSKESFIAAQMNALVTDRTLYHVAKNACDMAGYLNHRMSEFKAKGLEVVYPVNSNAVFIRMPQKMLSFLAKDYEIFAWSIDGDTALVRYMMSFSSTKHKIDVLLDHFNAFLNLPA